MILDPLQIDNFVNDVQKDIPAGMMPWTDNWSLREAVIKYPVHRGGTDVGFGLKITYPKSGSDHRPYSLSLENGICVSRLDVEPSRRYISVGKVIECGPRFFPWENLKPILMNGGIGLPEPVKPPAQLATFDDFIRWFMIENHIAVQFVPAKPF